MLSVAVIFFTFGLGAWVIGLYLVGMGANPTEGGKDPLLTVGWVEVIVGLILTTQVFILVQQAAGNALILTLATTVIGAIAAYATRSKWVPPLRDAMSFEREASKLKDIDS